MHRAFALLLLGLAFAAAPWSSSRVLAQSLTVDGRTDQQNAAELERLYAQSGTTRDPEEQLELVRKALEIEAELKFWPLHDPRDYVKAVLYFRRGGAYEVRRRGSRADNLEQSILAYRTARDLYVSPPLYYGEAWALTQIRLGNVLRKRIRGDRAENLEQAIAAYEQAEEVFSTAAAGPYWATLQENLGIAFADRIHGDRAQNIERAIKALAQALTIWTAEASPENWARIQIDLCVAYRKRLRESRSTNLEWAIDACNGALRVFQTRDDFPEQWGAAKHNLGAAYAVRLAGERAENLELAIGAYQEALTAHTQEDFPEEWADIQTDLGVAYSDRLKGEHQANLDLAVAAYRSAVAMLSAVEASPHDHLRTNRLLGEALLEKREWHAARAAFAAGREAFALLFREGVNEAEARDLLDRAGPLFAGAAYAAAEAGDREGALTLVNEGKARLLSVKLRQLLNVPPDKRARYDMLIAQIRELSRLVDATRGRERAEALERLIALRNELNEFVEGFQIRERPGDAIAAARAVVSDGGALVAPIVTKLGTKVLIVTAASEIGTFDLARLTSARLEAIAFGEVPGVLGGWRAQYEKSLRLAWLLRWIQQYESWRKTLPIVLFDAQYKEYKEEFARLNAEWRNAIEEIGDLGRFFVGDLQAALAGLGVRPGARLIFMPTGALGHLPLGLARESPDKPALAESYEIIYAPNLLALNAAREHIALGASPSATVIANPKGDLPFAEMEAAVVLAHFPPDARKILKRPDATREAVLSELAISNYWHFATHGKFSWEDARKSELVLSGGESLTVRELVEWTDGPGLPRLVTLSACESGLYDIRNNSDEFTGFPAAFLFLGAAGVLSTLWSVDDRATMLLMARFYDLHRDEGYAPPAALKEAQRWLRTASTDQLLAYARSRLDADTFAILEETFQNENIEVRHGVVIDLTEEIANQLATPHPPKAPRFAHPYYWAAFIYDGL